MKLILLHLLFTINLYSQSNLELIKSKLEKKNIQKIEFEYAESSEKLQHNFTPLKISTYNIKGKIVTGNNKFQKIDTLYTFNKNYSSKIYLDEKIILHNDYNKEKFTDIDSNVFNQEKIEISRYTPYYLFNYLIKSKFEIIDSYKYTILNTDINKNKITFKVNKSSNLIDEIITVKYDDNFGNDTTKFSYVEYDKSFNFPTKILVSKINGILNDTITITNIKYIDEINQFAKTPDDYNIIKFEEKEENISRTIITPKISFINFELAETRSLIVEFDTNLLIAEAPLESENGKILLDTLKKLYPNKPVKYFTFGHHHPHYTGGIRPFIDNETEVITIEEDIDYLTLLATNDHSLNPDALHNSKKKLKSRIFSDSLKISDKNTEMIIYHIGKLSNHTSDYCIYYFPKEKIIVEDDLIFMNKDESKWTKLNSRGESIYNFIENKNLEVKMIYQTWPINSLYYNTDIEYLDYRNNVLKFK